MTDLFKLNTTTPQHTTPETLLKMARSISDKMQSKNPKHTNTSTPTNPDDWQVVTRTDSVNKFYDIPNIIPPEPETSPAPATDLQIPLTIRITAPKQ
jgi:hypothetical protein